MEVKQCIDCKIVKPFDEFYNKPERSDGKASYCKACHKIRSYKYRAKDPDKHRKSVMKSYYKNREDRLTKMNQYQKKTEQDFWSVYLLPEEHYAGYTKNPIRRIREHGNKPLNRITDGAEIVMNFKTEKEATDYEAIFHSLGWYGKHENASKFCLKTWKYI